MSEKKTISAKQRSKVDMGFRFGDVHGIIAADIDTVLLVVKPGLKKTDKRTAPFKQVYVVWNLKSNSGSTERVELEDAADFIVNADNQILDLRRYQFLADRRPGQTVIRKLRRDGTVSAPVRLPLNADEYSGLNSDDLHIVRHEHDTWNKFSYSLFNEFGQAIFKSECCELAANQYFDAKYFDGSGIYGAVMMWQDPAKADAFLKPNPDMTALAWFDIESSELVVAEWILRKQHFFDMKFDGEVIRFKSQEINASGFQQQVADLEFRPQLGTLIHCGHFVIPGFPCLFYEYLETDGYSVLFSKYNPTRSNLEVVHYRSGGNEAWRSFNTELHTPDCSAFIQGRYIHWSSFRRSLVYRTLMED